MSLADSGRLAYRILEDIVVEDPDAAYVSFVDLDGQVEHAWTRAQAWEHARRLGAALLRADVQPGDRVLLMLGNQPEFISAFFGAALVGATVVPLNTAARGDQLEAMLEDSDPTVVLADEAYGEQLDECLHVLSRSLRHVVVVGEPWSADDSRLVAWDDFVAGAGLADPVEQHPWDLVALLFTSGTTGRSKGVMVSNNMLYRWAEAARFNIGYDEHDVAFTSLPIFHGNGLCCTLLPAMLGRSRLAFAPRFSASRFWRQVIETGATKTNLLGTMGTILWRQPESELDRAHSLELIMIVPVPLEYYEEFEERFGVHLTELYGLTDSAVPLAIPYGERQPGSCGVPTPGWECAVVNEADEPVERGEVGELVLRTHEPYMAMSGYWNRPEATVEAWRNLWFHTGDRVRQDEEGWFYFVDRDKDTIRRGGENIASMEVEQVVLAHPAVVSAAVYGPEDEVMGAEVMVAVVPQPDEEFDVEGLLAHCRRRLPKYAVPRYVRVMDAFPMTETEKIQKSALRDAGVTDDTWDALAVRTTP